MLLGERIFGSGVDHVAIDKVKAAVDATRHLIERGRRRIAAIGHQDKRGTAPQRTQGYRAALESAGWSYDPNSWSSGT
jgi:DNA-binding LacI/PurR family transcriptional regulator